MYTSCYFPESQTEKLRLGSSRINIPASRPYIPRRILYMDPYMYGWEAAIKFLLLPGYVDQKYLDSFSAFWYKYREVGIFL